MRRFRVRDRYMVEVEHIVAAEDLVDFFDRHPVPLTFFLASDGVVTQSQFLGYDGVEEVGPETEVPVRVPLG